MARLGVFGMLLLSKSAVMPSFTTSAMAVSLVAVSSVAAVNGDRAVGSGSFTILLMFRCEMMSVISVIPVPLLSSGCEGGVTFKITHLALRKAFLALQCKVAPRNIGAPAYTGVVTRFSKRVE